MSDAVAELASLFELYRIHYGQSPAPAATRAWVGEMARSGELEFYGAYHGPRMVGFAAIHQVPASLGLGRFWQLRDLFADPAVRRRGIARRLVETIRQASTSPDSDRPTDTNRSSTVGLCPDPVAEPRSAHRNAAGLLIVGRRDV